MTERRRCPVCGREFGAVTLKAIYCSNRCYYRAASDPAFMDRQRTARDARCDRLRDKMRGYLRKKGGAGTSLAELARVIGRGRTTVDVLLGAMPDVYEGDDGRLYYNDREVDR